MKLDLIEAERNKKMSHLLVNKLVQYYQEHNDSKPFGSFPAKLASATIANFDYNAKPDNNQCPSHKAEYRVNQNKPLKVILIWER